MLDERGHRKRVRHYDELGQEDGRLLQAAGLSAEAATAEGEAWRFDFGAEPGARGYVEASIGQGRLVLLPAPVLEREDEGEALAALIRGQVTPPAEAPGTTLELLLRRLPDGQHLLCAINRDPDEATEGDVVLQGEFARQACLVARLHSRTKIVRSEVVQQYDVHRQR